MPRSARRRTAPPLASAPETVAPMLVDQLIEQTQIVREIEIPQHRTVARAAEVRRINGRWTAVRLDGGPRVNFGTSPPPVE